MAQSNSAFTRAASLAQLVLALGPSPRPCLVETLPATLGTWRNVATASPSSPRVVKYCRVSVHCRSLIVRLASYLSCSQSPDTFTGLSGRVVSASDCPLTGPRFVIITMAMVDVDDSFQFSADSQPSRLAWSECWRPPGSQSTFIR